MSFAVPRPLLLIYPPLSYEDKQIKQYFTQNSVEIQTSGNQVVKVSTGRDEDELMVTYYERTEKSRKQFEEEVLAYDAAKAKHGVELAFWEARRLNFEKTEEDIERKELARLKVKYETPPAR